MGQGPTALAVGAGGHFFSRLSFLFYFSLSLGDGPVQTKILSQMAVKPKTTNKVELINHVLALFFNFYRCHVFFPICCCNLVSVVKAT